MFLENLIYLPINIVLDTNNRIIVKTSNGFRCIVSCTKSKGLIKMRFISRTVTFDSHGNM